METGGSMLHTQELSINPYTELDQRHSLYCIHFNIVFPSIHKYLFLVGLPVKILKALLLSHILATWPTEGNLLDLITQIILDER